MRAHRPLTGLYTRSKVSFTVLDCPQIAALIAEAYNTVLCANSWLAHTNADVMMGNEALCDMCSRNLDVERTHQPEQLARTDHFLSDGTLSVSTEG